MAVAQDQLQRATCKEGEEEGFPGSKEEEEMSIYKYLGSVEEHDETT